MMVPDLITCRVDMLWCVLDQYVIDVSNLVSYFSEVIFICPMVWFLNKPPKPINPAPIKIILTGPFKVMPAKWKRFVWSHRPPATTVSQIKPNPQWRNLPIHFIMRLLCKTSATTGNTGGQNFLAQAVLKYSNSWWWAREKYLTFSRHIIGRNCSA